ncbi:MAG: sigma-70 family RNA polymerase sigma factor [Planctomycetia bacterium]|nr:sigma-70 family RNA polymerase sigma factor [Planctomycetia bacterium]
MVANRIPLTTGQASREQVVQRAQAGDRAAYGELVRRFAPAVYATALTRLGNPVEAEEIAQEVFVHSMSKLGQLRDARCVGGWLRQIAIRLALGRLTRRGQSSDSAEQLQGLTAADAGPLDQLIRSEDQQRLRAGLGRLKPLDRAMLEAFYLRCRSLREISHEFQVPIGTIKRRLHVARGRLKRQLETGTSAD